MKTVGKQGAAPALTRRSFLKSTGLAAGAAGLAGTLGGLTALGEKELASADQAGEEQIFSGVCRGCCAEGCFQNYHVRDGKVVRITARDFPDPAYNRICLRGMSQVQRINSPDRIKYPMKRVGERGAGQWERISWDEAIGTITDTWKRNLAEYGPRSVGYSERTGQTGWVFTLVYKRLKTMMGGVNFITPADAQFNKGFRDALGLRPEGFGANDQSDYHNARTILMVGVNFTETYQHQWHWVYEAQKMGAKLIVVDPKFSGIASKADKYVPIRPGTDAAMFMALMNIAIEKEWVDWDFLRKQTVAPCLVKASDGVLLRAKDAGGSADDDTLMVLDAKTGELGRIDEVADPVMTGATEAAGIKVSSPWDLLVEAIKDYTPEKASQICDISVDDLYEIAEAFCTQGPSSMKIGDGVDHRMWASSVYISGCAFSMITGNLGRAGSRNGYESIAVPYNSGKMAKPRGGGEPLGPLVQMTVSQFPSIMEQGKYGDEEAPLKMLIVHGHDFVRGRGDRNKTLKLIDKLDLLVSINLTMNDTSLYADIVLPVAEWCEYEDANGNATYYPFAVLGEKAVESPYECKSDFEIVKLLFEGMGHPEWFDWETPGDVLEECYGKEFYARLKKDKAVYHQYFVDNGYQFVYGSDGYWGTTSGKAQFYIEKPVRGKKPFDTALDYGQQRDLDYQRLPAWRPPEEGWNQSVPGHEKSKLSEKYPLTMMSSHSRWHAQTCNNRVPALRELDPEPTIIISAADAASRGISTGDHVRAFNDRGQAVLKAIVHAGMRPGNVDMPNGWVADQYIDGHFANLMNDAVDPNCENLNSSDALVEVELWTGEVK